MIKGLAFSLRLINLSDATDILKLRNNSEINKYINNTSTSVDDQIRWIKKYNKKDDDLYFAVVNNKTKNVEGYISLYNINYNLGTAELGRWIIKPGSLAATESIFLVYKLAFEQLSLSNVYTKTVASNTKVVKFHKHFGSRTQENPIYQPLNGVATKSIFQYVERAEWYKDVKLDMLPKVVKIAKRVLQ